MSVYRGHEPPPAAVVAELVRCGVSFGTAMAMEKWKAQEVLELLSAQYMRESAYLQEMAERRAKA